MTRGAHSDLICPLGVVVAEDRPTAPNGGSARVLLELLAHGPGLV